MRTDKIILKGMAFYGYHGARPAEQEVGQRFVVDIEIYKDTSAAGRSDNLIDTVSYSEFYRITKQVIEGPNRKLLENLAEVIAKEILEIHDVDAVKVSIKKPEVPIKGSILDYAGVEIFRKK